MSSKSVRYAVFPTLVSASHIPSIFKAVFEDALADYAKISGTDLSENRFVVKTGQADSPEAILQLLQEQANIFRDDDQTLAVVLSCAVNDLYALSGILGAAVGTVNHT
jgi:hypothetical protein